MTHDYFKNVILPIFEAAHKEFGIENLRKTSFFMSNNERYQLSKKAA